MVMSYTSLPPSFSFSTRLVGLHRREFIVIAFLAEVFYFGRGDRHTVLAGWSTGEFDPRNLFGARSGPGPSSGLRFPLPHQPTALPMPPDRGVRLHDGQSLSPRKQP